MDLEKFDPEDSLATLLSKTTRAISTRLHSLFVNAGFDVTPEQWMILLLLWAEDGRFPYQIADVIGKDRAAVTRLLDGLEERNLVVRVVDKNNNRQKQVFLTKQGQAIKDSLVPLGIANIQKAQAGLDSNDIEICKRVLRRMYRNIMQ